ncbi:MAG: hypothetical protein N2485_06330 [bacterium]|nr:hypothetical protein [bacterium]
MFLPFSKPTLKYLEEDLVRLTVIEGEKWAYMYGIVINNDKQNFKVFIPNLVQFLAMDLGIINGKKTDCSILEPIKDSVYIFSFETIIKDINEQSKELTLEKPKNLKEKNLGKIENLLKNLDIEAELEIEYNALGVPHTQKGKTYKILSNGMSLFTAIPIPNGTILEVVVKIPYKEYIDRKGDKFKAKVVDSKQLEKKKFETFLEFETIDEELKKQIFEFALINSNIDK